MNFEPIFEMEFREVSTGATVTVRLSAPLFDQNSGMYSCMSEVDGVEGGERQIVYDDTQFGALTNSLLRFRLVFERATGDFRDTQGSAPHMYFPREIPWVYGSDVYEKLCKMVDSEVQKVEDDRTRRRESRNRRDEP